MEVVQKRWCQSKYGENGNNTNFVYSILQPRSISKDKGVWDGVDVDLEVRDDLGNQYYGEGNGGSGEDSYNFNWSKTFQQLNENATKLIITPHVNLRIHTPENYGSVTIVEGQVKERFVPRRLGGNKGIVLDDIVIDLKK